MAYLHRVNRSRLNLLSQQFRRHYVQIPFESSPKYTPAASRWSAVENPCWGFCRRTTEFCYNVRFFAAPVQKKVNKEEDSRGPRLNDQITARYVRLVSDDGHSVVSLGEALRQAKKLEVDLVEVQRNADPPVCKLMNFHKDKYMRELKAKELAKSKAGVTLRKGSCKEVRFSEKTEDKDLKMKADTVLRLMERGYRVKCVALGSKKKGSDPGDEDEEDNGLATLLSRITSLIEDVAVVESGPRVEKQQAFAIVRHAKFGPSKKGGAKKLKNATKVANVQPIANGSAPSEGYAVFEEDNAESGTETDNDFSTEEDDILEKNLVDDRSTWASVDSTRDFDKVFDHGDGAKVRIANPSMDGSAVPEAASFGLHHSVPKFSRHGPAQDIRTEARLPSSTLQPSPAAENRYKRNEQRNQFSPTTPADDGIDRRGQSRIEPQFSNQRRQPQAPINTGPVVGERQPARSDSSSFRNLRQPSNETPNQTSPSDSSNTPLSSYGIFSSSKPSPPGKPGGAPEIDRIAEGNRYSSQKPGFDGSQRLRINNGGQGGRGVFGRDGRNDPS